MKKKFCNQKGVAIELAIVTLLVIFALCSILLTVAEIGVSTNRHVAQDVKHRAELSQIIDDIVSSVQGNETAGLADRISEYAKYYLFDWSEDLTVCTIRDRETQEVILVIHLSDYINTEPEPSGEPSGEPTEPQSGEPTTTPGPSEQPTETQGGDPTETQSGEPAATPGQSEQPTETQGGDPTEPQSGEPTATPGPTEQPTETQGGDPTETQSGEPTATPGPTEQPTETQGGDPEDPENGDKNDPGGTEPGQQNAGD